MELNTQKQDENQGPLFSSVPANYNDVEKTAMFQPIDHFSSPSGLF